LFQHLFHGAPSDVEEPEQVSGEKGVAVLRCEISERLVQEDACIIHQDIDASKVADCRLDGLGSRLLLANFAIEQNQLAGAFNF
jgi:hypothetical protein